jgi:hypothetical protein
MIHARTTRALLMGTAVATAGCPAPGSEDGDASDTLPPPTTTLNPSTDTTADDGQSDTSPGMTSDATTMGTTSPADTGANTTDVPVFDLGTLPDSPPSDMGCRKVDFLFAIDNSGSMSAQQVQLLNSFQGFIDAIQASLEDTVDSYHVGVVTSDDYVNNAPGCQTIGDLVSQTGGFQALGQDCTPFAEGYRFATEQDDLSVKFPCIAQIGTSGSFIEQPVTATIAALDPAKAGPGDCNEEFLRDDAILVIVILTDDPPYNADFDDAHPDTDTSGWYQAVIDAKNGDPEAMVVIGFIPWNDISCVPLTLESPNLIGFVDAFGKQGVKASICEPDFGPIFAQTVETIVTTCQNFDPPG